MKNLRFLLLKLRTLRSSIETSVRLRRNSCKNEKKKMLSFLVMLTPHWSVKKVNCVTDLGKIKGVLNFVSFRVNDFIDQPGVNLSQFQVINRF